MLLDEHERLRRLIGLGIGQERHDFLDTITALAASTLKCPIALVSLVEEERQFFASRHGLESTSTGRDVSFCAHCIADQTPLIVENAVADPRFAQNPLVVGDPSIRSYLGFPLFGGAGQSALGTFCVIDQEVRVWTDEEKEFVGRLASMVEAYLEGLVYVRFGTPHRWLLSCLMRPDCVSGPTPHLAASSAGLWRRWLINRCRPASCRPTAACSTPWWSPRRPAGTSRPDVHCDTCA
jgi:hypothetical protein